MRPRLLLHLWCLVLTGAVLWPFLSTLFSYLTPGDAPVSLILRDMVVPHSMALNDLATGRDGLPRAVPQDTVLAWLSPVVPPPVAVSVLVLGGGYVGALGAAALARHVGGTTAAVVAAPALTLWNPFVAERLLQGHWSLVLAGMLLPTVALAAMRRSGRSLLLLVLLTAVCALTPTGLLLATGTALVAAVAGAVSVSRLLTIAGAGVALSLPWVLSTLLHAGAGATQSDSAGAELFAPRAEPGVGTLGSLMGLGGIWNAEAVPGSRESLAPVSTVAGVVLAVAAVAVVSVALVRRRALRAAPLLWLALAAVLVPALMSTSPGLAVTGWLLEYVPGAGLVRDSQKFVVLAVPGLVVLLAHGSALAAEAGRRTAVASGAIVLTLVWLAVPALPRDVAELAPVRLDAAYDEVVEQVEVWQDVHGDEHGDGYGTPRTLLWPPGSYRVIEDRPALDPALKMLPGSPVDPGYLIVDGELVDGDPESIATLNELAGGEDTLAERGIDLVVVEDTTEDAGDTGDTAAAVAGVLADHREVWSSGGWRLFEVTG